MNRLLLLSFLLILPVSAALAQNGRVFTPASLVDDVDTYSTRLRSLAVSVQRDAYIVTQLTAASADLSQEFQKHVALEKARDHVQAAMRRAVEDPPASATVRTAISQANDIVEHWRDNASSADLADVNRQLLQKTDDVQRVLFRELDEVKKSRVGVRDLLKKLASANDDLDDATNEALAATLGFFRAGGGK